MRMNEGRRTNHKTAVLAHRVVGGELKTEAVMVNFGERFRRNKGAVDGEKGGK